MRLLPLLLIVACAEAPPVEAELAGERAVLSDGPLFDAERLPRIRVVRGAAGPWRVRLNGDEVPIDVERRGEDVLLVVRSADIAAGPAALALDGPGERTWAVRWGARSALVDR